MGNVHACCGEEETSPQANAIIADISVQDTAKADAQVTDTSASYTESKPIPTQDFFQKLKEAMDVELTIQDSSRLKCKLMLENSIEKLQIMYEKRMKTLNFSEIKAFLHTPEQLKLVDSQAGITADSPCVAIQLSQTNNCIPLFFKDNPEKSYFVAAMKKICGLYQKSIVV